MPILVGLGNSWAILGQFGQFLGNSKNGFCPKNRPSHYHFGGFSRFGQFGQFFFLHRPTPRTMHLHCGCPPLYAQNHFWLPLITFFLPKLPKLKKSASMVSFRGFFLGNSLKIIAQLFAQNCPKLPKCCPNDPICHRWMLHGTMQYIAPPTPCGIAAAACRSMQHGG